jgi:hypothetical protein
MSEPIFTVGHSNRAIDDFLALLRESGIEAIVDVRRLPGSARYPQFDADTLASTLHAAGVDYRREESLTGRRGRIRDVPQEVNAWWENRSFHNYADHALSAEFARGLAGLIEEGAGRPTAVMCSEAVWWRCHRRIIADHLLARELPVRHVLGAGNVAAAELSAGAAIGPDGVVTYPADPTSASTTDAAEGCPPHTAHRERPGGRGVQGLMQASPTRARRRSLSAPEAGDMAQQTVGDGRTAHARPFVSSCEDDPGGDLPVVIDPGVTVREAVLRTPVTSAPGTSVGAIRQYLGATALVVDGERLVTVLESADLPDEVPDDSPADDLGTLAGRTVAPDADLAETRRSMLDSGRYRLAVVDEHGTFHGLLCLTHDGQGFCSGGGDRA